MLGDVRVGSNSAAPSYGTRGCFTPQSRHADRSPSRQLRAKNRRKQVQQNGTYSITSSAAACSGRGTLSPSAFAVFKLMTISNFVGN
jgi:hypothetical protein